MGKECKKLFSIITERDISMPYVIDVKNAFLIEPTDHIGNEQIYCLDDWSNIVVVKLLQKDMVRSVEVEAPESLEAYKKDISLFLEKHWVIARRDIKSTEPKLFKFILKLIVQRREKK